MTTLGRRALPLLPLVLFACGAPPPGPAVPPPAPVVQTTPPKDAPVDVSPVPEPPNLVVVARVNKPEAIVKAVGTWTQLPLPGGRELLRSIAPDTVADIVDTSQPLDAAVTVSLSAHGVEPLAAFSVGVRSFDDAKAKISTKYKMDPVTNGGFKIRGIMSKSDRRGHADGDDDDDGRGDDGGDVCVLAHSATGAKLVCGPSNAVDALTPYLSRTMPRERWPADVHVEVRPEPVRGPLQDMRGMLPMLAKSAIGSNSQAVRDLVDASVGEALDIVDDAQKLMLDGTIDDSGVVATTHFEFQGSKSLFARVLTDTGRADSAPAAFWHLPGDTDTALFVRGAEPKLYDRPREILTALLVEGMDAAALPPAEKKAVHDIVADRMLKLFTNGGTGIYAKGFDQAGLEKAVKARAALKDDDWGGRREAKRAIGEQVIGWHLYQVSDPVAKVGPILKDWSALWNRPAFAKWIEQQTGTSKKEMPRMRVAGDPAGVKLPKDTVHLEVTFPVDSSEPPSFAMPSNPTQPPGRPGSAPPPPKPVAKKATPAKPVVIHVFAVPDGASTWLAFGADDKLVGSKVAAALSSAPEAGTLGKTAQGLEALKEPKINGGALLTMRGFLVVTAFDDGDRSMFSKLGLLPHKATAPVVLMSRAEAASPQARAGTSVGQMRVSRQVIEDIVKLIFASR